ncbi:hypothetical protein BaRGS_00037663 [Batillaria attramentaria]|uniref:Uncharacterized protein n=1 Tax=Batillaria attramentaria TaxID=370345 RepID=A0ABD0J8E7_9CAEN
MLTLDDDQVYDADALRRQVQNQPPVTSVYYSQCALFLSGLLVFALGASVNLNVCLVRWRFKSFDTRNRVSDPQRSSSA